MNTVGSLLQSRELWCPTRALCEVVCRAWSIDILPTSGVRICFWSAGSTGSKVFWNSRKPQMRLDDNVQPASTNEAVRSGERNAKLIHHFCNADRGRSGHANPTMYKSGNTSLSSFLCWGSNQLCNWTLEAWTTY